MDIYSTANEYKQLVAKREGEIADIETKYNILLHPYMKDIALMTFLEERNRVIFERWETEKKRNFLESLDKHKVKYNIEKRGMGYDTYEVVHINW